MVLNIGDWVLQVDVDMNMEHSSAQAADHCQCGYCRNFYAAIDQACPALRPFLSAFGLNVEGPDELCPFEPTIYEVSFIVNGKILHTGTQLPRIGDIPLEIKTAQQANMETERPLPYFVLIIGLIELPWVLEEPMEEVISPANEDAYLQRMWNKLLTRADQDNLLS